MGLSGTSGQPQLRAVSAALSSFLCASLVEDAFTTAVNHQGLMMKRQRFPHIIRMHVSVFAAQFSPPFFVRGVKFSRFQTQFGHNSSQFGEHGPKMGKTGVLTDFTN